LTITLDLAPDIEQGLLAQARAKGVSITDYVEEIVARQARQAPAAATQPKSLVQFFGESPLVGLDLDLERDKDAGKDITL
jgi:hypothetical protein